MNGPGASSTHTLLRVSAAGVRHAARLRHLPLGELTRRIYGYHALPLGSAMQSQLRTWSDVADWLGLARDDEWVRTLARTFVATPDPAGHWMHWRRPAAVGGLVHKLYISPRPAAMPALFARLIPAFVALDVPAFKIGASARDLLRPDKLVVYFASRDHLVACSEELAASLRQVPAHGVPFTAPIDPAGLLSWGYDPEVAGGSWRIWVVRLLAAGIAGAPPGSIDDIVTHASGVLRSAGVDPDCWEPIASVLP